MTLEMGNYVRINTEGCALECSKGHPGGHRQFDGAVGKFEADLTDHLGHDCFWGRTIHSKKVKCVVCDVESSAEDAVKTGHSFIVHDFPNSTGVYLFKGDELEDLGVSDFDGLVALATEREYSYTTIGASPEGERQSRAIAQTFWGDVTVCLS